MLREQYWGGWGGGRGGEEEGGGVHASKSFKYVCYILQSCEWDLIIKKRKMQENIL